VPFDPKHDDPSLLARRVRANVRKVQIQRNQDSIVRPARACDRIVIRTREILVRNVSATNPAPRKISAASIGRFSSVLNFTP
jgi:hypothetical protein